VQLLCRPLSQDETARGFSSTDPELPLRADSSVRRRAGAPAGR